jgi:oligosaccharide reducing-end xylanase
MKAPRNSLGSRVLVLCVAAAAGVVSTLGCSASSESGAGGSGTGGDGTGSGGSPATGGSGGGGSGGAVAAGSGGGVGSGGAVGSGSGGVGAMGGAASKGTDLFVTLAGKAQTDVDAKVTTAVNRFFGIGTGEPAALTAGSGYRVYYQLPQDASLGFVWAADSNDVRSEGMSYGMLIAVQMDLRTQFDSLWKFAKQYMQYPSNTATAAWKYYFKWQGTVNSANATSWTVTFGGTTGPAPDGDQYFAAALYLADKRWGSTGTYNYKQEADNISGAMLHNAATSDSRFPLISTSQNMVVFYPYSGSNAFTDPSYHLPAFYELFAAYGPSGDSARWKSLASVSRTFLVTSANATTGLHPDYATFSGSPTTAQSGDGHDQFGFDAWRVVMNMAVDYEWFSADSRLKTQVEKYQTFFGSYLGTNNVTQSQFTVTGGSPTGGGSTALTGTLAVGSFASTTSNRATYVNNLWNVAQQNGTYRYYQECLYVMSLLHVSGKFALSW